MLNSVRLRLLSVAYWMFLGVAAALLFPVAVVIWAATGPFDRRLVVLHRFTCLWGALYTG